MYMDSIKHTLEFYSHVICLGTKIRFCAHFGIPPFYSHVICLGTKIIKARGNARSGFTVT